jgi:uncharacterized protein with FMN-binding domain
MRRVVLALGGTIAGLVMLLSFRTHMGSAAVAGVSGAGGKTGSGGTSASGTGGSAGSAGAAGSAGGVAAAAPASVSAGSGTGTAVTGNVIMTGYGPTQVQLTLNAGKIVRVTVLQHTDDGASSQVIDGHALPVLNSETLTAQSARINAVSGASYTSAGYIKSLQSALDKARA